MTPKERADQVIRQAYQRLSFTPWKPNFMVAFKTKPLEQCDEIEIQGAATANIAIRRMISS